MPATVDDRLQRALRWVIGIALACAMLSFGAILAVGSYQILNDWRFIQTGLASCGVLFGATGTAMLACGVWALVSGGRQKRAFWIGGSATALAGAVLITGTVRGAIPCSGPS